MKSKKKIKSEMTEEQPDTVSDPQRNAEHGKVCTREEEENGTVVKERKKEKNNTCQHRLTQRQILYTFP